MQKLKVFVKGVAVTVGTCCPNDAHKRKIKNWSLKQLSGGQEADETNPLVAGLRDVLKKMGAHKAYAPRVSVFSGKVIKTSEVLWEQFNLSEGIALKLNRSVPADGIFLNRGRSFVMSGAGCPIIIASDGTHMIVAHAGRDSLIDRGAVIGKPTRPYISVVEQIAEKFLDQGTPLEEVEMGMMLAIPAHTFEHRFDHETHGGYNRLLAKFVGREWPNGCLTSDHAICLDLEKLFKAQAEQLGVKTWTAHPICQYPNLAHTRDGGDPSRRNLIVVKRDH